MDIKKIVKNKYKSLASKKCGCSCSGVKQEEAVAKAIGYSAEELAQAGEANLGLGCGNPVAISQIKAGDTVVDLGSGAGIDCILAAKKTGPQGKVIGVDMTEEMVIKAKQNVSQAGLNNIEFKLGDIEDLLLEDNSVDVVISNCVINLAPDKDKVFKEIYRILKPGGKMFVSDIVLLEELDPAVRQNEDLIAGCVGGALLKQDYVAKVKAAGFEVKLAKENTKISKEQYNGINLESLTIEATKVI